MINNVDDNFDDIDIDELFNDFDEKQISIPQPTLIQYNFNFKTNRDNLIEFNQNDYKEPKVNRKRTKTKTKIPTKQTTIYDYISTVSYKNRQFYSSLDNTITTKTIYKGQKRSLANDSPPSTPISKKSKTFEYDTLSSTPPPPPPDFIDNLLRYLDERSHHKIEHSIDERKSLDLDHTKK